MLGAYTVYWLVGYTDNLFVAIALGLAIMLAFGYRLERDAPLQQRGIPPGVMH